MDPEILAAMAKSYAYQIGKGVDPVQARAYLRREFPFATQNNIRQVVSHAQRGITVGERMRTLNPDQPLRDALGRMRPPHEQVGVRVHIWITRPARFRGRERESEQHVTVYLNLRWDDTRSRVDEEVRRYVQSGRRSYGREAEYHWDFSGPTWWPAGYP